MRLFITILVLVANYVFAMEKATESEQALYFEKDEQGNNSVRFTTKAALENFLNARTGNENWEKHKPKPGTDMFKFIKENPILVIQSQTQFLLVKSQAPGFWNAFLEEFPGNSFSVKELAAKIKTIGEEILKERIANNNNESVYFTLGMLTNMQSQGFIDIFFEEKNSLKVF